MNICLLKQNDRIFWNGIKLNFLLQCWIQPGCIITTRSKDFQTMFLVLSVTKIVLCYVF